MKNSKKIAKLTPAQYWEWRTTVAELNNAKLNVELGQHKHQIAVMNAVLAKRELQDIILKKIEIKKEYDRYTQELEKKLGTKFANKIIDPVTYEILEEPQKEIKNGSN